MIPYTIPSLRRRLLSSGESSNQTHTATRLDEHTKTERAVFVFPCTRGANRLGCCFSKKRVFLFKHPRRPAVSSSVHVRVYFWGSSVSSAFSTQPGWKLGIFFWDGCRTAVWFPWTNFIILRCWLMRQPQSALCSARARVEKTRRCVCWF